MDNYYQDIHIINNKTRDEYVIRQVHIVQIDVATKQIKIHFGVNDIYKHIVFDKKDNTLTID